MDKRILYGLGALVAGYVGIKMVKAESYSAEEGIYEVITQQQVDDEMECEGCPHTFKVGDSYVQDGDYPTCVTCAKDFKTCIDCEEVYNPEGEHKWSKTCSYCRGSGFIMTSYTSATYDDPAEADGDDCEACDGLGYVCEEGEGYGAESFSASGSGDLTYEGGRMVSIEEVTIVDYNWHTDPDETDDIDESDIESQVQEKVENEMYEGDSGNDSWSYGTDSDGTNVEVYYEWNKTVEDGEEEYIKGW